MIKIRESIISQEHRLMVIPIFSMADVAFLLLVFFLVTNTLNVDKDVTVSLPESEYTKTIDQERLFEITVDKRGTIYVDGAVTSPNTLARVTKEERRTHPETIFLIKGDEVISYERIDVVLSALKENGIENVVLVAKDSETE